MKSVGRDLELGRRLPDQRVAHLGTVAMWNVMNNLNFILAADPSKVTESSVFLQVLQTTFPRVL